MRVAAALAGLLMLALPAFVVPAGALALTAVGILAVAASLIGRVRLPGSARGLEFAGTLAAVIAVIQCAVWLPGTAMLAAEGLAILAYLMLLDGLRIPGRTVAVRWLGGQVRQAVAALIASCAVAAALAVPAAVSPWLVLAGLACLVAAYLAAVPRRRRPGG